MGCRVVACVGFDLDDRAADTVDEHGDADEIGRKFGSGAIKIGELGDIVQVSTRSAPLSRMG